MQSFCQFYAETCNLTDYLENCSVSFSVARRLCRQCLLPCISCISCPKDVRKFCPFIYFLPTWHPFNDNLLEIVSCFLCCLLFTLYASLLFGFFFSGTFDAYLRVNCISFSNVLSPSLSCSLAPSMAIMLSVFIQQFPVKMLKSWKVHCSQMQATHSWQRDSQADSQTDRLRERQSVCRLTNWPKGAAFVEKNMATPRYATQAGCAQWEAFKLAAPHGRDTSRHSQTMCTM